MREADAGKRLEAEVRSAFVELATTVLPAAAAARGWPVACPARFEQLLLDHVTGAPCCMSEGRPANAARLIDLILAVELGARLLDGAICVAELDRRSRALRKKARDPGAHGSARNRESCTGAVADLLERAAAAQAPTRRARR